ncbi:MAG: FkbM family methyltransferase [Thermodesulfobacteriota bacterium]
MPRPRRRVERAHCASSTSLLVKVGANDGITGDPFSSLLQGRTGWRALFIEPVPYCTERLRTNFPDRERFSIEEVAIGPSSGSVPFFYVDPKAHDNIPELPVWFDQLGSFDRKHILKHFAGILDPYIICRDIETQPLSHVLEAHGIENPDLLHIDTEGYDFEVLKTLDIARHTPPLLFVEHKHLNGTQKQEMHEFLQNSGYAVHECGGDSIAINRKAIRALRRTAKYF